MYIFTTIIQLLWVLDNILAEKALQNIIRGSKVQLATSSLYTRVSFELKCGFEDVTLDATVYRTDWTNTRNLKLRIEAFDAKNRFIRSYEVKNIILSPNKKKEINKKDILEQELCKSFDVKSTTVQNQKLFMIKFYNDGEWWCDVYTGYTFNYKEMDKCSEVERDYKALNENIYNSVDTATKTELSDKWSTCDSAEPVDLCGKIDKYFEVKARPFCYDGRKIQRITTYYNGAQLESYTITKFRTQPLVGELDGKKVCKLFRFQLDDKAAGRVFVQYLKDGVWKCRKFQKKKDRYQLKPWLRICQRFRNYERPKISFTN